MKFKSDRNELYKIEVRSILRKGVRCENLQETEKIVNVINFQKASVAEVWLYDIVEEVERVKVTYRLACDMLG